MSTKFFQERGYVISRTGWGKEDFHFSFKSEPRPFKIHDQSDENSFTFYALGEKFITDSGAANSRIPNSPSQTVAHNYILIDGKGQALSGQGDTTGGNITAFHSSDSMDFIQGDSRASFCRDDFNPVELAERHVLFVKTPPPYLIIFDTIQKDDHAHDYELLFHTHRGNRIIPDKEKQKGVIKSAKDTELLLFFLNPTLDGMDAKTYAFGSSREKYLHPYLSVQSKAVNPHFISILVPRKGNRPAPVISFDKRDGKYYYAIITWEGGSKTDHLCIIADRPQEPWSNEVMTTDAEFTFLRISGDSSPPQFAFINGTKLQMQNSLLIDARGTKVSQLR